MKEMWKNYAITAKRNVDDNEDPISIQLLELKQVMDIHSCIVLNQLPDIQQGIHIEGYTEVFDIEKLSSKNYKVDYANGVVYFNPVNIGKTLTVEYQGIGYTLLSASRIYTKYDKQGNVLETLEELIDNVKLQLKAIEYLGGAVEVITKLENENKTGASLHESLLSDIEIGTPLNASLNTNIQDGSALLPELVKVNNTATQKKKELDQSTTQATNTNELLTRTNQSATQTNLTLQQAIATGQDSVNKINATGNKSLVIGASNFVNNEYTWVHNMNNDNLIVSFIDSETNEPLMQDYKIIDKNNILIRNSAEHPNIKVVLSASYYQGNALFGTNVEEFAGDSIVANAKKVRFKDGNGVVENPITDSDAVFMPDGTTKLTKTISDINSSLEQIVCNVKTFGAKGDGSTDDTSAIESADKKNNILFFPKGTYITSYCPSNKCKGEGSTLIVNGYTMTLCDVAQEVNSIWQTYIRMNNTTLGVDCGKNLNSNSYGNTAIGNNALKNNSATVRNTAVGNNSLMDLTEGYANTSIGVDSLHLSKYSDRNTMVGSTCGKNIGNPNPNSTNGLFNGNVDTLTNYDNYWEGWREYAGTVGNCKHVPTSSTETTSNVGIGRNALGFAQKPTRNVAIGYNALEGGLASDNCVAIGENALQFGIKSINTVCIGGRAGYHLMDTNQDVVIGRGAMSETVHSDKNVAIGYQSMLGSLADNNSLPVSNVAIGRLSLANYNGNIQYNVGVGEQSLLLNNGNGNVGIGYSALAKNIDGNYNTSIGHNSANRNGADSFNNTTSIGANSYCSGSNQVQLGDSSTNTYIYGTIQTRSDERDKTDIEETKLGLEFINKLRPVDYRYDYREDYKIYDDEGNLVAEEKKDGSKKRIRKHHGLLAQDVKKVMDDLGVDFGGFQDHKINGGKDVMSIGYEELIAPLIKAIQELSLKVEELEKLN